MVVRAAAVGALLTPAALLYPRQPPRHSVRSTPDKQRSRPSFPWRLFDLAHAEASRDSEATPLKSVKTRIDTLPDIPAAEVRQHGRDASKIYVTYGDGVFDVTDFVDAHPGGRLILLAAGRALDPYFESYPQHKQHFVYEMLSEMRVGNLVRDQQWVEEVDKKSAHFAIDAAYAHQPSRDDRLIVRSERPFTAEPPAQLLVREQNTANEIFYVRNHMPVPRIDEDEYELEIVDVHGNTLLQLSLEELQTQFEKSCVQTAIQCGGNRRTEMDEVQLVKGGVWGVGAIGNATWCGARLNDVLQYAAEQSGRDVKQVMRDVRHVCFEGLDRDVATDTHYEASVPVEVTEGSADVLLAYEMNGQRLGRDHGFPVRVVVPGVVGARHVKWVGTIRLSKVESESHWQQRDYRVVQTLDEAAYEAAPSIQYMPVVSAICDVQRRGKLLQLRGYAWSGSGSGVARVEVSCDDGKSWQAAELLPTGADAGEDLFAWRIWSAELRVEHARQVMCRAVDASYNAQPAHVRDVWNARGLVNNAWHKVVVDDAVDANNAP